MSNAAQNLLEFMPGGMRPDDPLLNAIMSDENGIGAVANEINDILDYIRLISRNDDFHNLKGTEMELFVQTFTGIIRRNQESEISYLKLFQALMQRGCADVFGTKTDIMGIFRFIIPPEVVLDIVENTGEKNIIQNPDFINNEQNWVLQGNAELSNMDCFAGKLSCRLFGQNGILYQEFETSNYADKVYSAHIFIRGSARIGVLDLSNNKYFDSESFSWKEEETFAIIKSKTGAVSDEWENGYIFFRDDIGYNNFRLILKYDNGECFIDHIRVYKKPDNPSFSLLLRYTGYQVSNKTLMLDETYAGGDPSAGEDYNAKAYFEYAPITGPITGGTHDYFSFILDLVKPAGVEFYFDDNLLKEI